MSGVGVGSSATTSALTWTRMLSRRRQGAIPVATIGATTHVTAMRSGGTLALMQASPETLASTARQDVTWIDFDEDAQVVPVSDSI